MRYMFLPFRRYFDFQGRSRRLEFWMFALLNICVFILFGIIFTALFVGVLFQLGRDYGYENYERIGSQGYQVGWTSDIPPAVLFDAVGPIGTTLLVAVTLYSLLIFIPALAVTIRRLHDSDRTGWWAAIPYGLNLILLLLTFAAVAAPAALALVAALGSLLSFLGFIASIVLLVFMFLSGTRGPNRFGPDPKGPDVARAFA